MPSLLRSPLSRLLAAVLALLTSPIAASARLINSSTGLAAKRFDPMGSSGNSFVCPTYGPDEVAPRTLEGIDDGPTTRCEYFVTDLYVAQRICENGSTCADTVLCV
jgi:hypothetical protein